jgi:hypothetical protein
MSTFSLVAFPYLLGILCAACGASVTNASSSLLDADIRNMLILCCVFLLWSVPGFVFIIRKEIPPIFVIHIEGVLAVVIGILWVIGHLFVVSLPIQWYFTR